MSAGLSLGHTNPSTKRGFEGTLLLHYSPFLFNFSVLLFILQTPFNNPRHSDLNKPQKGVTSKYDWLQLLPFVTICKIVTTFLNEIE